MQTSAKNPERVSRIQGSGIPLRFIAPLLDPTDTIIITLIESARTMLGCGEFYLFFSFNWVERAISRWSGRTHLRMVIETVRTYPKPKCDSRPRRAEMLSYAGIIWNRRTCDRLIARCLTIALTIQIAFHRPRQPNKQMPCISSRSNRPLSIWMYLNVFAGNSVNTGAINHRRICQSESGCFHQPG